MRTKTITLDCDKCDDMEVDQDNRFICKWGNGEAKVMNPHKGKRPIKCKLKK